MKRMAAGAAAPGGFLGFRRKDPRIRTVTYVHASSISLFEKAIAVQPFASPQLGLPSPPDFAPYLVRALTWALPESTVKEASRTPDGKADVLVSGQIDLFHRLGAGGLRIAITAGVASTSDGCRRTVWLGQKKADWIRRFSTDDCLLLLADDFVRTWVEGG